MAQKYTILFVEDEPDISSMHQMKFQSAGHTFLVADNVAEGLKITQSKNPDLVLLDIKLRDESGLDLLEKLKANKKTKDIPVFLFSNAYQKEYEKRGLELGAEKFLVKTKVLPSDMVKMVEEFLG